MNEVYCLFINYSDGYTYSSQVLVGVFKTHDEAEEGILKYLDIDNSEELTVDDFEIECFKFNSLRFY